MKRLIKPGGAFLLVLIVALGALVGPAGHASAASSLRLSRYFAAPGDTVTVTGFGFSPRDDVVIGVNLVVNGRSQRVNTSAATDNSGAFTAAFTVPGGTNQGSYIVNARDFHGHVANQHLVVYPVAHLVVGGKVTTTYIIPQHAFYVRGSGFQPGELIALSASFPLYNGNTTVVSHNVQATANGAFNEVFFRVPRDARAGTTTIVATGAVSKRTARGNLRVIYRPFLLNAGTARPGTTVSIQGRDFVPNSTVNVYLPVGRNGSTTLTLSRAVTADGNGNFGTSLVLPPNVRLGRYTITAIDATGGSRAHTTVLVSQHPTITVQPAALFPGEAITVTGDNFGTGSRVTVSATFPLQGGGSKTVSSTVIAASGGRYSTSIAAPANAAAGRVTVTAHSSNGQVSTSFTVNARPTPIPTSRPAPTSTPVPTAVPTATPKPKHHRTFDFRYVSIWYHTVRIGTYDHLVAQSTLHTVQGIWVHVWFPSGQGDLAFFTNTDANGFWQSQIPVGTNTIAANNGHVLVTFRLWHGKQSREKFSGFTLVR